MLDELFATLPTDTTRRGFVRTIGLAAAAAALPFPQESAEARVVSDARELILRYVALSAGPRSREADLLMRAIERARIDSTICQLDDGSAFHRAYAPEVVLHTSTIEVRLNTGAYMRAERAVFHDSMVPRLIKDVNLCEMRGSAFPGIIEYFGVVPFPCGERKPMNQLLAEDFEKTLEAYYRRYGVDLSYCNLNDVRYVRPANTVQRIAEGKGPVPSFSVPARENKLENKQNYTLLFGPDAMG